MPMIPRARFWYLGRLAALPIGIAIVFLSGLFPLQDLLLLNTQSLTASIAAYDVASLTNEQRVQNGLAPLSVSPLLTQAAQDKAQDMAQNSYYAHVSPDGKTPLYWLDYVGYRYLNAGENLVIDRTTSEEAVDAWMRSPDHRENILRPQFTEIGIGVAKGEYEGISTIFVVQEFGTPYPTTRTISVAPKAVPATPVSVPAVVPVIPVPPAPISIPSIAKTIPKVTAPRIATLAPKAPTVAAATTTASAATTTAGQGTSTISYALAPEFYAPVTVSIGPNSQQGASATAPKASSATALSVLFQHVRQFFGHLFNKAQ